MARAAIHAPRQAVSITIDPNAPSPTVSKIFGPPTSPGVGTVITDSALTTYTSYSRTTYTSSGTIYEQSSPVVSIILKPAQLSSLAANGAFSTPTTSGTTPTAIAGTSGSGTAGAASTSSAASSHKSSNTKSGTLIPAIVVPIVVVLLLVTFGAFFFYMRRRHHRALEEEARFEKVKPSTSRSVRPDNSSSRNLLAAGDSLAQSADDKPKQGTTVKVTPLSNSQVTGPPRPRRPEENDFPSNAIGVARSTSSASAVPAQSAPRPPRSAHEMRSLPTNPRPTDYHRPRDPYLSGGDIIDSYAEMRPSTAPSNGSRRGPPPSSYMDMRTPLPVKPMGRPPPKNANPLPPTSNSKPPGQSPSSRTTSPAPWPATFHAPNTTARSRAQAGTPDSSYGLTEENLRIARLGTGANSSLGMARQTLDNASISDIDEHDHARAHRDDASDISELDEEQERMASGMNSPMGNGRGTPMSGRMGTPLSGRGYAR